METVSHHCRATVHLTWPDPAVKSVASASWLVLVVTVIPRIISSCYYVWHLIGLEYKRFV